MAGRVDGATHAAAIAKIGEAVKHQGELRAHVDEIVKGAAFKGSQRSQTFLKHIVEHALHGAPVDLRERSIGVALFGRLVAYLRYRRRCHRAGNRERCPKRLLQALWHYGSRIQLPHQSSRRFVRARILHRPSCCACSASSAGGRRPTAAAGRAPRSGTPGMELARACVRACNPLITVAAAFAVKRWTSSGGANDNLFVGAFQGTPRSVQVVVADDALVLIQVLLDRRFTLEAYENLPQKTAEWPRSQINPQI